MYCDGVLFQTRQNAPPSSVNVGGIQRCYRCRSLSVVVGDAVDVCHVVALSMLAYPGSAAATKSQLHARRWRRGPAVEVLEEDVGVPKCERRDIRSDGRESARTIPGADGRVVAQATRCAEVISGKFAERQPTSPHLTHPPTHFHITCRTS